jgi:predicted phosphodiesterase
MAAIDANDMQWFSSLKDWIEISIGKYRIGVYHEAPIKGNEYVYPDCNEDVKAALFSTGYDILVLGHSHYQFMFEKNGRYVLNPGSVGQSRAHGGYADWASVGMNENNIDIRLHSEKYSIGNLIQQVEEFDPGMKYLKEVLTRVG